MNGCVLLEGLHRDIFYGTNVMGMSVWHALKRNLQLVFVTFSSHLSHSFQNRCVIMLGRQDSFVSAALFVETRAGPDVWEHRWLEAGAGRGAGLLIAIGFPPPLKAAAAEAPRTSVTQALFHASHSSWEGTQDEVFALSSESPVDVRVRWWRLSYGSNSASLAATERASRRLLLTSCAITCVAA